MLDSVDLVDLDVQGDPEDGHFHVEMTLAFRDERDTVRQAFFADIIAVDCTVMDIKNRAARVADDFEPEELNDDKVMLMFDRYLSNRLDPIQAWVDDVSLL